MKAGIGSEEADGTSMPARDPEIARLRDEIEAAHKDLESFTYSVSHDLRAPLRIIDGMSEIVLRDYAERLDDEGKELLTAIRANVSRMDQLIVALLDLSRVGRQEMTTEEIDMEKTAALIADDLRAEAPERRITVSIDNPPPARGDLTLIRLALSNLIANAVKFTRDKDEAIIEIAGRREGDENVYFVKDNGAGFDMRYANKLFGVLQRLHRASEFAGLGIGLSIVQRIIRRHGGRVWAEGVPGEGATFFFSLPA